MENGTKINQENIDQFLSCHQNNHIIAHCNVLSILKNDESSCILIRNQNNYPFSMILEISEQTLSDFNDLVNLPTESILNFENEFEIETFVGFVLEDNNATPCNLNMIYDLIGQEASVFVAQKIFGYRVCINKKNGYLIILSNYFFGCTFWKILNEEEMKTMFQELKIQIKI